MTKNPNFDPTPQAQEFADRICDPIGQASDSTDGEVRSLLLFRQGAVAALPTISRDQARRWSAAVLAGAPAVEAGVGASPVALVSRWFRVSQGTRWLGRALALYAGIVLGLWVARHFVEEAPPRTVSVNSVASEEGRSGK